ncbi:MAG: O-antigen ligase family protein [Planctomycetota bacterium]
MNSRIHVKDKNLYDLMIETFLVISILFSFFAASPEFPWTRGVVMAMALLMTGVWLLQGVRQNPIRSVPIPVWILVLIAGSLTSIYLVPLSIDPRATTQALMHGLSLAMILIVVMSTVRTRGQIITLILVLTVAGLIQVAYGVAEQVGRDTRLMPDRHTLSLLSLTGTFFSGQNFSGLLEMIVPVSLGLFIALSPRRTRSAPVRTRLVSFLPVKISSAQIFLGSSLIVLMAGICFSLSRAGVLCLIASWVGFALVFSMVIRLRARTISLLFVLMLILGIALGLGSQMIIDRVERPTSEQTVSWPDRLDLWKASLAMARDYPLLGAGPGTYAKAMNLILPEGSDKSAPLSPHSDLIKIACETGGLGLLAVLGTGLLLLCCLIRKTLAQKEAFHRCIATGCMISICVMTVHSLYEGNLVGVTSNGVVFAVILGLWLAAAKAGDGAIALREGTECGH